MLEATSIDDGFRSLAISIILVENNGRIFIDGGIVDSQYRVTAFVVNVDTPLVACGD